MKVKILVDAILENSQSEEDLLEYSTIESIYEIRRLKTALMFRDKMINVEQVNNSGQIYIEATQIWINKGEYIQVE